MQQGAFYYACTDRIKDHELTMLYDLTAVTGKPWPFETLAQIGEMYQKTLMRMTDLHLDLYKRNLDTMLDLAGKTTGAWKESSDEYLSLVDRIYQEDKKNTVTVTKTVKAAKKKTAAAVKKTRARSGAASKATSTIK